ncbi:tetratricopeptide repeat protein [Halochromatium salexigens]|nr:tetratricopeptide repeat protein [Halochromatium salexigens]
MRIETLLVGSLLFASISVNAAVCPEFSGRGLDYTNPKDRKRLGLVEKFHFTEDVRSLRKGASSYLIDDLEYVLNFFPNHHPALNALARLVIREGTPLPPHADANIECRFRWAEQAQPMDAMVPVIQGVYYSRVGRPEDAKTALEKAVKLAPDNPEVNYNLGLALYDLEEYEGARSYARKAYRGGYPLPGLRNMLERAGYPLSD